VGLFVLLHFYSNSYSTKGAEAYDTHLRSLDSLPFMGVVQVLFIYAPILFHAALGIGITLRGGANVRAYPYLGNWRYLLQRVSGIGVLLFVGAHVYKTQLEPWLNGFTIDFAHMQEGMHEPLTFTVYVLGILGTSYHLANGVWTFCITWGFTVSRMAQHRLTVVSVLLFLFIFLVGINNMMGFLGYGLGL